MFTSRFEEALSFAARLHRAQSRKGRSVPYVSHLLGVASLVIEDGGAEDQAIAALLHDAIEDQGNQYPGGRAGLRQEIERRFGTAVLELVNACTDDDACEDKSDAGAWRPRKQAHLDHIPAIGAAARRVSCADNLHNARCLLADFREAGDQVWGSFRTGSAADQLWYYGELAAAFQAANTGLLAAELARVVADLSAAVTAAKRT
ncbi:MAG: HD domain-containing protein [Acidobacteria bacterium]|nr:HD domain-containing protein [Acidobacteriota bacterium]